MFNRDSIGLENNPFFEIDVLFGIGEIPSFVSVILDKERYSVSICLNEPEDDDSEIKVEDDVEILNLKLSSLSEAKEYYNFVRKPRNIAKVVTEYKNKGK